MSERQSHGLTDLHLTDQTSEKVGNHIKVENQKKRTFDKVHNQKTVGNWKKVGNHKCRKSVKVENLKKIENWEIWISEKLGFLKKCIRLEKEEVRKSRKLQN